MTETFAHKALKEEAKKIIRIDVVGFNNERKIGVECGTCTITKLESMEKIFDEVIFLPFNFKKKKGKVRNKIFFFTRYRNMF